MKKLFTLIIVLFSVFSLSVRQVDASLLVVTPDGQLVWNVLSDETSFSLDTPRHSSIEVKKVGAEDGKKDSLISLKREEGKISLIVSSDNEIRELNVTENQKELVEIEERPETQKLAIGIVGDKFSLKQKNILALTSYPIEIDAKSAKLFVMTSKGNEFLSILPLQAIESALRSRLISQTAGSLEIIEHVEGLGYKIEGTKVFNLLNVFEYSIPVTAFVSASTGEILQIDSPTIFKYLDFLFI